MASHLEEQFAILWESFYPELPLEREHRFAPERRYRADFAHLESKVIVEIQGGIWVRQRTSHSSGTGIHRDCEKLCLAQSMGWAYFALTDKMFTNHWIEAIAQTIRERSLQSSR